jgi:hypothetical protein
MARPFPRAGALAIALIATAAAALPNSAAPRERSNSVDLYGTRPCRGLFDACHGTGVARFLCFRLGPLLRIALHLDRAPSGSGSAELRSADIDSLTFSVSVAPSCAAAMADRPAAVAAAPLPCCSSACGAEATWSVACRSPQAAKVARTRAAEAVFNRFV